MGCRPSKADNDTAAMHMLSKTDSDYIRQATRTVLKSECFKSKHFSCFDNCRTCFYLVKWNKIAGIVCKSIYPRCAAHYPYRDKEEK